MNRRIIALAVLLAAVGSVAVHAAPRHGSSRHLLQQTQQQLNVDLSQTAADVAITAGSALVPQCNWREQQCSLNLPYAFALPKPVDDAGK